MKTVKLVTAVILASMMALSTSAAIFVPSKEAYVPGIVDGTNPDTGDDYTGKIYDKDGDLFDYIDGEDGEDIFIVFDKDDEKATDEIKENLTEAEKDLTENDLKDIVDGYEDSWKEATGGAPIENGGITNIFEIVIPTDKLPEGGKVEVQIVVNEITKDDKFVVIGKDGEEWTIVDYTIDDNNVITIVVENPTGDNTFAIIVDTTAEPTPGDDSPQTGVAAYSVAVIACAAVLCGVAYIVIRKATKSRTAA